MQSAVPPSVSDVLVQIVVGVPADSAVLTRISFRCLCTALSVLHMESNMRTVRALIYKPPRPGQVLEPLWVFAVYWLFSMGLRPGFLPSRPHFRVRVSVAVVLSTETSLPTLSFRNGHHVSLHANLLDVPLYHQSGIGKGVLFDQGFLGIVPIGAGFF